MKKLWLCCFLILTSPVFAAERTDYRDFTPEKRQQVTDRWNAQFDGVKKQIALTEKIASGKMDTMISQIDGEHKIRTMIRDSGYDPDTGKKIRIEADVTQTANKAKVASTLTDRLKKAADYAKKSGKASIPAFVGGAAVQALVDGVGWVIDEGGKVTKEPDEDQKPINSYQKIWCWNHSPPKGCGGSPASAGRATASLFNLTYKSSEIIQPNLQAKITLEDSNGQSREIYVLYGSNENYDPNALVEPQEVTQEQLTEALKNALESNNPALAAAISQAIKDAYTPEGKLVSIGDEQANGLAVDAADTARDAVNKAAKNTGTEPTSSGKPGYYKITDGEKTVEGYVYPTEPTGTITPQPDTGTGTEPGTGTGTGTGTSTGGATFELPPFCDWAGIVCDFIEWYKTEPEDDSPELPEHELEKKEIDKDLLNVGGSSCPQDLTVNWSGLPFGITINESIEMQPYCNELEPLKYVFILITTCLCAFMFVRL